jgi:methenyltetrahydrofolate cyclohydrolase
MFLERTLADYIDALASSEPTPGGGSTAALAGSLAASLVSMVCNLTIGKRRYREAEPTLREVLAQAEALRGRLGELMERDVAAYDGVMRAYRLPQGTAQEQDARQGAMQQALQEATRVPLEIAEGCAQVIELALPAAELGNPWAVSDAGAAALLAEAALHSALLNVQINLRSLHEGPFAQEARRRQQELADRAQEKDRVVALVQQRIMSQ